ncbi:iron ABC transporter [Sphaerisporangium siamense]|uniref:Iron complex transport system permease protein n=1 Tax=Sphaerisporangium siamense TaxID=795645 RepID=A0A7W7G8A4_9ACTN|nr:iron ABC transporter permease [Sphaerisporangium siamense]MBB4699354.1 iron complex transport system permease protein [Sphaerisporangium siamense]GII89265.1 iron ABC transporter [Sphaerisporangium siamense]
MTAVTAAAVPTGYRRHRVVLSAMAVAVPIAFTLAVALGSTWIPLDDALRALIHDATALPGVQEIIWTVRLPRAITAALAGAALAAAGAQMQTLFRNPLAEPYILGVSSGASLGVALVIAGWGGVAGTFTAGVAGLGRAGVVVAASGGAAAVLGLVLALSRRVWSVVTLLVIGVMVGSAATSVITLLLVYTDPQRAQQFISWGLGSFAGPTWADLAVFGPVCAAALGGALAGVKPLNALLLGETYARTMGVRVRLVRTLTLLTSSVLAGAVTAYCGPIAFLGLAVPHVARLALGTADHRVLMPGVVLLGAVTALMCCVATQAPGSGVVLPLNAVATILGAPVVIAVLVRSRVARTGLAV